MKKTSHNHYMVSSQEDWDELLEALGASFKLDLDLPKGGLEFPCMALVQATPFTPKGSPIRVRVVSTAQYGEMMRAMFDRLLKTEG